MKTIAYKDLASGTMYQYVSPSQSDLFKRENSEERIKRALAELRHVGNIALYLVRGNKIRRISIHGM